MTDEAPDSGRTLREHLAGRDTPCDQCSYNLRGAKAIFCPECGAVIPRPPAEELDRAQMNPAELQLWCADCDYIVTGVNAKRCPECAGTNLVRFSGDRPRMRGRSWFRPRGMPVPLWLNALLGILVLGAAAVTFLTNFLSRGPVLGAVISALLASIPVAVAIIWQLSRHNIVRRPARQRLQAAVVAFAIGCFGWVFAVLAMR